MDPELLLLVQIVLREVTPIKVALRGTAPLAVDLVILPLNIFQYHGFSMSPTFHPGDMLTVRALAFRDIRPGDVVTFRLPGDAGLIVHRVVARAADGLLTQGDACAAPDATRVPAEALVGRVLQAQRGTRTRPVWNGLAGRWWAHALRLRRRAFALGRAPYGWLRASGLVRRLWRPRIARVTLATAHGPLVKYLCGARTVAVWQPETRAYWCRKPYDLVLDTPIPRASQPCE